MARSKSEPMINNSDIVKPADTGLTNHKIAMPSHTRPELTKAIVCLNSLGLGDDPRIIRVFENNPEYIKRLTSLFVTLSECSIPLSDCTVEVIASNVHKSSAILNLLKFMKNELNIDLKHIQLDQIAGASDNAEEFRFGLRELKRTNCSNPTTINLLLRYPINASSLARLLNEFQERAYDNEPLVPQLQKFSPQNMGIVTELLILILAKGYFYPELIAIFLRQEEFLNKIYVGTKKLLAADKLPPNYFKIIELNPKNANIIAKNILLIDRLSIFDYCKEADQLSISQLGAGVYYFLYYLEKVDMLTKESFHVAHQNRLLLDRMEIVGIFSDIPLFAVVSKAKLIQLLDLINNNNSTTLHIDEFTSITRDLMEQPQNESTSNVLSL